MSESRKIVLVLGNGFDLDLGLRTSYKDFWESEFCPKDYPAPIIKHLNERWNEALEAVRWYDLENELMNYYRKVSLLGLKVDVITGEEEQFVREIDQVHLSYGFDNKYIGAANSLLQKGYIVENPRIIPRYLMPYREDMLRSTVWRDRRALDLIKEGLYNYLKSIEKPIHENLSIAFQLLLAISKCVEAGNTVSIYTFNYTRVQMRGYNLRDVPVNYMHGSCDDGKIIVGTRDGTPMEPEYDFLQKVMDDSFNPPDIVSALNKTDEVIIFGHSLGENDRQYFEQFFSQQASIDNLTKKDIFIFTRDDASKIEIKRALKSLTGDRLSVLMSINQPAIIRTGNLKADQKLLYNFLVAHHTDEHFASEVIGKLLANDPEKEGKR
ncbi:MAG: AbiH family protein [Candidatus Cryptobacteroides sp.]